MKISAEILAKEEAQVIASGVGRRRPGRQPYLRAVSFVVGQSGVRHGSPA